MATAGAYGAATLGEAFFYGGRPLDDGQFEIGYGSSSFKFGEGTTFLVMNPAEVYSTEVRSQDQPRLGHPGTVAGYDLYSQRQIVLQAMIRGTSVADLQQKIERWKQAFAPVQSGAVPLRWKIKGVANRYVVFGRPRRTQVNEATMGARYVRVAQEFVCHDPRIYEDVLREHTITELPKGGAFLAKRDPHVYLPGLNNNYLYTSRATASGTITTLDVSVKVGLRTWQPGGYEMLVARWYVSDPGGNKLMWRFGYNGSDYLELITSADGSSTQQTYTSTATVGGAVDAPATDDYAVRWLRVKLTGVGSGTATATFHYSSSSSYTAPADGDGSWVQLGSTVSKTTNTGILSSQAVNLVVGGLQYYNADTQYCAAARVYGVYVNETGGSGVIANMAVNSTGTFTDTVTANSWQIVSSAVGDRKAEFRDWSLTQPWESKDTPDVSGTVEPIFTVYQPSSVTMSWDDSSYLSLPGSTNSYVYAGAVSADNLGGGFDVRAKVATKWASSAATQALVSKWDTSGNQRSFTFRYLGSTDKLQLSVSSDGTTSTSYSSTATIGLTDDTVRWVRAVFTGDTGVATSKVWFYTSVDGVSWTLLGNPVVSATVLSAYASTASLTVGGELAGTSSTNLLTGSVYKAEFRDSSGVVVAKPDFAYLYAGSTSVTDAVGRTWSLAGSASVVGSPVGTVESPLAIQITGPATNPRIVDNITGAKLFFTDLDLSKHWDEKLFILDEFTATNGTAAGGRTPTYRAAGYPTAGTTWTALNSTWDVQGNQLRQYTQNASKNNLLYFSPETSVGTSNGYIEARITTPSALQGLLFRYYHGATSGYVVRNESDRSVKLWSFTADTGEANWTEVAVVKNASWRYGQTVRVEFVNEYIRVYVDNVLILKYIDTVRNSSSLYRGFGFAGTSTGGVPSGVRWDAFEMGLVTVSADPDEMVLDCYEHAAYKNGTENVRSVMTVSGDWPMVHLGANSFTLSSDSLTRNQADVPVRFWYRKAFM